MKSSSLSFSLIFLVFFSYSQTIESDYIQVLGIVQDAGYPHIGCEKDCCKVVSPGDYFVSCLGLVDKTNNKRYLFDATPDIHNQINLLEKFPEANLIDGIFLTHAHIGHYTGLMYLGREGLGGKNIMVYALKRMARFLSKNGPWDAIWCSKCSTVTPKASKMEPWAVILITFFWEKPTLHPTAYLLCFRHILQVLGLPVLMQFLVEMCLGSRSPKKAVTLSLFSHL